MTDAELDALQSRLKHIWESTVPFDVVAKEAADAIAALRAENARLRQIAISASDPTQRQEFYRRTEGWTAEAAPTSEEAESVAARLDFCSPEELPRHAGDAAAYIRSQARAIARLEAELQNYYRAGLQPHAELLQRAERAEARLQAGEPSEYWQRLVNEHRKELEARAERAEQDHDALRAELAMQKNYLRDAESEIETLRAALASAEAGIRPEFRQRGVRADE